MNGLNIECNFFGETNQGLVRTNNEDSYICQKIWDDSHILCAAIDGLGGYEGGEIAAEIARATIIKHLEDFASNKVSDLLKEAMIDANNEIVRQHMSRPKVSQMGCVVSVGLIDLSEKTLTIAHVGDSRIYQFFNGELKKLTHDHSLVGYREEIGEMSEEDAMHHPKRNVIDKFLGEQQLSYDSSNYVEISVWPIIGDTQYLFCSDGLTDLVTSKQIVEVLSTNISIGEKVNRLIACANEAGGKDNVTVVIADVKATEADKADNELEETAATSDVSEDRVKAKTHKNRFLPGCLLGIILGAASVYAFNLNNNKKDIEAQSNRIEVLKDSVALLEDSIIKISSEASQILVLSSDLYSEEAPQDQI